MYMIWYTQSTYLGHLPHFRHHLICLQETEDQELEQGVKKEFLRGTFSIMEFDENSKEMLDELKVCALYSTVQDVSIP